MEHRDSFHGWVIVEPGTSRLLHWCVYHIASDAILEAQQWLRPDQYEVKQIGRRMNMLHTPGTISAKDIQKMLREPLDILQRS